MYTSRGFEQNQFQEVLPRYMPSYEANEDSIVIRDPVWGECSIGDWPGDRIFFQLLDNSLVRRSMAIEQLTLDASTATIPGTAQFSRWEHIWGSVALVRKMTQDMPELTDRERLVLQLRTFVSDLGHTAYSHLGDWIFQGAGGPENQHDDELPRIMEVSGINDILRRNGFEPEEVIFPHVEDWIECKAPDLCVDRVDYGAREIKRWLNVNIDVWDALTPDAFSVVNDRLVMSNQRAATAFGKAFLLLSTEHWSEPAHRLQLKLQEELVKHVLANEYSHLLAINPFDIGNYHPRDLLYTIDDDITTEMYKFGTFTNVVRPLMQEIASSKRRIFSLERLSQLSLYMSQETDEYPDPAEHYGYFGRRVGKLPLQPSNLSIVPVVSPADVADFGKHPDTVDFYLTPLKPRNIDPLFIDDDNSLQRLSQADPNFASLRHQQAVLLQQAYVARLHVNDMTKDILQSGITENEENWKRALTRNRMPAKIFRETLHNSVAIAAASRMIDLSWNR